jgi:acetoin utilization protein AcuB
MPAEAREFSRLLRRSGYCCTGHGDGGPVMLVADVMTPHPLTIGPDAPLATARAAMVERAVRHLPVVDDRGRVIGVLSDRDIRDAMVAPAVAEFLSPAACRRLRGLGEALESLRVDRVMTWGAVVIEPAAPVARAAAVMFEARVGCLPVVDHGSLVGIVTERDALQALAATLPAVKGLDPDAFLW